MMDNIVVLSVCIIHILPLNLNQLTAGPGSPTSPVSPVCPGNPYTLEYTCVHVYISAIYTCMYTHIMDMHKQTDTQR